MNKIGRAAILTACAASVLGLAAGTASAAPTHSTAAASAMVRGDMPECDSDTYMQYWTGPNGWVWQCQGVATGYSWVHVGP